MLLFKTLFLFILIPREFSFFLGPLSLTPYRVLLTAIAPLVIYSIISRRKFKWSAPDTFATLLCVWPILALTINSGLLKGIESGGILFLELFIPFFLARQTMISYERLKKFTIFLLSVIFILVVPAIPETITGKNYIHDFFTAITGNPFFIRDEQRLGLWRARSFIDSSIIFGAICSIGFVLALSMLRRHYKYLFYAGVSVAGVIASVSSAPLLGLVSQFGFFVWSKLMDRKAYKWTILIIILLTVYILIDIASNRDPFRVAFSYLLFSEHNGYIRYYMWINSIFLINQSFFSALFGYGFSLEHFDLIDNFFFSNIMKKSVDSYWLVNLLRYGWPMFCLLGFLVVSVLRHNVNQVPKLKTLKNERNLLEGWFITVLGYTLISFSVHFWGGASSIYMIILACACTSVSHKKRGIKPQSSLPE